MLSDGLFRLYPVHVLIFLFCCHASAYVTFAFILDEYFPYLRVERKIDVAQAFGYVFMYGTFANTEAFCRGTDCRAILYDIFRQFTGAFLNVEFQRHHSQHSKP